jgi:hypothetical protein
MPDDAGHSWREGYWAGVEIGLYAARAIYRQNGERRRTENAIDDLASDIDAFHHHRPPATKREA